MAQEQDNGKSPFPAGFERDVKSLVMLEDYGIISKLEVRDNLERLGVVLHDPERVFWFMQLEADGEEMVRQASEEPAEAPRRRAPWNSEQEG